MHEAIMSGSGTSSASLDKVLNSCSNEGFACFLEREHYKKLMDWVVNKNNEGRINKARGSIYSAIQTINADILKLDLIIAYNRNNKSNSSNTNKVEEILSEGIWAYMLALVNTYKNTNNNLLKQLIIASNDVINKINTKDPKEAKRQLLGIMRLLQAILMKTIIK